MAEPSPTDRLVAAFSPPLDSALVHAILSDYADPLSHDDELQARSTLQSLADQADLVDHDSELALDSGRDPPRRPDSRDSDTADPRPPVDERAELLAIINQANHSLRLDRTRSSSNASPVDSRTAQPRPRAPASATASDLSSALEHSSLDDDSSSADPRPSSADAPRFWDDHHAPASLTSDEDGAAAPRLVWDAPDGGFDYEVSDDPLAFLASVFPHIDLAQLEAKIAEVKSLEPTEDGLAAQPADLERLIEDLLSQDLITSLAEADADAAAAENAPAPDPDGIAAMDRQQRRRHKVATKAAQSLSLTTTPHVSYAKAATHRPQGSLSALADAPLSTNAWASISSQASFLAAAMHLSVARITSTYHAHGSSLARTVAVLLVQLARERPFESLAGGVARKNELRLIVPAAKASDDHLEALLSATEGDLSDALDLLSFIADLEKAVGAPLPLSALIVRPGAGSALAATTTTTTPDGFTVVSTPTRTPSMRAPHAVAAAAAGSDDRYTHEQCHALALEYLAKRNDAFRTAARSFQRGGMGERGAAGFWADRGREFDGERRKWEERAARAAVGERRTKTGANVVDLHGLSLAHALKIVDEVTNTWWSNARDSTHPEPLRIITGVGRHSRGGTPILAPAVTKHLDRTGWRWKWDDGPLVAGGIGPVNSKGAVRVIGVAR
ncbi:uncharacterized protein RHOBADRAFT_49837 [Rhodotorula graminis WP1]|uniref:Smr domain-containing protein n=1 Tax=Rhodotorula graminis (strain WP1) TaxID=578459 RepID=A0A194S0V5_RHOGW|nr:uncharacterized protein RHOBADRAFT_49837 [Rhodotorula graminis WP1]KPV74175.1 hypothetical protein RHOBADRAFT_49837 [Rhodotorula graminis WP1]